MKTFYQLMLHLVRFELAVARSTGRSQENIAALSQDECRWEHALFLQEVNHG